MFFHWCQSCFNPEFHSPSTWRQRRLKFLKSMRDDLETRLAAINAAIATIERQNSQEEV
ncbi:MAG: hypothetical protein AAF298_28185 [Cyanobacteria bacterium P01_A01_bin.40]